MTPLLQGAVDAVVPDDDALGLVGAVRREVAEGALHPVEAAARLLAARELVLRRLYCRDEEEDEEEGEESLPLDGAREGRHVVLDEEGVDEGDRDRAQQRARHERAPVEDVAAHALGIDPDRDRLLLGRREEDEGVEELVPGQGEREDPGGEDPGHGERKADAYHSLDAARPVDSGAVLDLPWNGL